MKAQHLNTLMYGKITMNTEQPNNDPLAASIGKKFYVYTPTKVPYLGTLKAISDKELFFVGKDGKQKIVPRGMYDIEEVRHEL